MLQKMSKILLSIFFIFCAGKLYCQPGSYTNIKFYPVYGNKPLYPENHSYPLNKGDSIKIETLKFYISNLQFLDNSSIVYTENNSFHLIDAAVDSTLLLSIHNPSMPGYDEIKFNLGIDSITNTAGAMDGDLDPTRGMYWTWQSGYINFKLEGSCAACPTRNHEFQFHLGGYLAPFNSLQTIRLKVNKINPVNIYLDLQKFFAVVDLSTLNHVMSPNKQAKDLSEITAKCFYTR